MSTYQDNVSHTVREAQFRTRHVIRLACRRSSIREDVDEFHGDIPAGFLKQGLTCNDGETKVPQRPLMLVSTCQRSAQIGTQSTSETLHMHTAASLAYRSCNSQFHARETHLVQCLRLWGILVAITKHKF
nr:hypothetical protein CFP56_12203 [Quercus suber]